MEASWDHYTWWRARREYAHYLADNQNLRLKEVAARLGVSQKYAAKLRDKHQWSLDKGEDYGWKDGARQPV